MKIVTLMENEAITKDLKAAHGLSIYIETKMHKILFDTGPNNDFIKNAKQLGVKLEEVDFVVISHGHYDHGGGLVKFMKINQKAKIYLSKFAFQKHAKAKKDDYTDIGIKEPKDKSRFVEITTNTKIDEELTLFLKVPYKRQIISDDALLVYENGHFVRDEFHHEIYLIVHEGNKDVLFSGCSHKGIELIIDTIEKVQNVVITHVFGGYHFSHYDPKSVVETNYLKQLGEKWQSMEQSTFYSCHCTGDLAFNQLKPYLKNKLFRLKTGSVVNI